MAEAGGQFTANIFSVMNGQKDVMPFFCAMEAVPFVVQVGNWKYIIERMIAVDCIAQELKLRNARLWAFPGGTIVPLFDACHRYNVEVIITCSEFGAGMAAIGAFKAGGRMQFVATTSGPGATNLVTPIAEAFYDSCPIIFLTGQVATTNLVGVSRQKGFQQTPIVEIVRPITKMTCQASSPSHLVNSFKSAIQFATAGRGGPCLVDMPMNLQKGEIE